MNSKQCPSIKGAKSEGLKEKFHKEQSNDLPLWSPKGLPAHHLNKFNSKVSDGPIDKTLPSSPL